MQTSRCFIIVLLTMMLMFANKPDRTVVVFDHQTKDVLKWSTIPLEPRLTPHIFVLWCFRDWSDELASSATENFHLLQSIIIILGSYSIQYINMRLLSIKAGIMRIKGSNHMWTEQINRCYGWFSLCSASSVWKWHIHLNTVPKANQNPL